MKFLSMPVLLSALSLAACSPSGPEPAPDFIGKWAAEPSPGMLFEVQFFPDRTFQSFLTESGIIISATDGVWSHEPPNLITRDTQCQEGPPLRLVACTSPPDTVRPVIIGDAWPLHLVDGGEIVSLQLRRVQ